jgi:hypothetical protein
MLGKVTLVFVAIGALATPACTPASSGGGSGGKTGSGGGAGGSAGAGGNSSGSGGVLACQDTTITASEDTNYSFTSALHFKPLKVQPKTNLSFEWGQLSKDFLGLDVDPKSEINMVSLIPWSLTVDDVRTKMDNEDLDNSYIIGGIPLSLKTDGKSTTTKVLDMTINGSVIGSDGGQLTVDQAMSFLDPDKYDPAKTCYTFLAASGTNVGQGSRMIQPFVLDRSSTETTVKVDNSSTTLDFTAVLDKLTPVGIPAGKSKITIDWSKISKNAMGRDFLSVNIDRIMVAHYTQTPAELQRNDTFPKLEKIATALYSMTLDIVAPRADLSQLTDSSGKAFPGIDGTGTWIVALMCNTATCRNPAPWYLTLLKPCS